MDSLALFGRPHVPSTDTRNELLLFTSHHDIFWFLNKMFFYENTSRNCVSTCSRATKIGTWVQQDVFDLAWTGFVVTVRGGVVRSMIPSKSTMTGPQQHLLDTWYSRVRKLTTWSVLRSRTKTLQGSPTPISRTPSHFLVVHMSPVLVPGMNYYYLYNVMTIFGSEMKGFL